MYDITSLLLLLMRFPICIVPYIPVFTFTIFCVDSANAFIQTELRVHYSRYVTRQTVTIQILDKAFILKVKKATVSLKVHTKENKAH